MLNFKNTIQVKLDFQIIRCFSWTKKTKEARGTTKANPAVGVAMRLFVMRRHGVILYVKYMLSGDASPFVSDSTRYFYKISSIHVSLTFREGSMTENVW